MKRPVPVLFVSLVALAAILSEACSPKADLSFDYGAAAENLDATSITVRAIVGEESVMEDLAPFMPKWRSHT